MKIEEMLSEEGFNSFPKPHYLLDKDIEKWDEYDWSNFKSIMNKIIRGNPI